MNDDERIQRISNILAFLSRDISKSRILSKEAMDLYQTLTEEGKKRAHPLIEGLAMLALFEDSQNNLINQEISKLPLNERRQL